MRVREGASDFFAVAIGHTAQAVLRLMIWDFIDLAVHLVDSPIESR